jgi:diguanylate cyclase (GGDEF)-like protein
MESISELETIKGLYDSLEFMDLNKFNILIIEDSSQVNKVICSVLEPNYQLIFSKKGTEIVKISQLQKPELILIDVTMSELDGYELCSRLNANPSTHNIPILLISYQEGEDDTKGFTAGAADFIIKPIRPLVLKARVNHYIELKRCRDLLEEQIPVNKITNIANRSQLIYLATREWHRAIRHQTPQSIIMLDIDFFRIYKDYYGSLAGDDCMRQIISILMKNMKREPDLIARYKDNEFACLLPETDACGAVNVANSIQESLEELNIPFKRSQLCNHVTMSIGVATMRPALGQTPNLLIHQAELLLSEAKRAGHNQIRCLQGC